MRTDTQIIIMLVVMLGVLAYGIPTLATKYFTTENGVYDAY